ncbi:hypothetical protein TSUD_344090 [Trifolium subterraneum]|nr:hypothetical protein TSUD_344090 [Trifolium subterraneum]
MTETTHPPSPKSTSTSAIQTTSTSVIQTAISPIHPALTVSNITNFIKVTLDIEKIQYNTWSELFKIHARAYEVLDHIIPPSPTDSTASSSLKETDPSLWKRLDAIVLTWIYGTISTDLLHTIIERDSTAQLAWDQLFDIFFDNKNSRTLYLEQEFSRVSMEQFSDATSYCQHIKSLFYQLSNVGAPISDERMVLQLASGLSDAYANVGSQIRHSDTLPPAHEDNNSDYPPSHHPNRNNNKHNGGRGGRGGSGHNRGGRSRGRGGGRGGRYHHHQQGSWQQPHTPQHQWAYPPWNAQWQPWATPPCPYPTTGNWQRPVDPIRQPGILGAKPQQAHVATTQSSYAPTDIQAAMHTLSLAPPDEQWYMDTGATSHMTANRGFSDRNAFNEM